MNGKGKKNISYLRIENILLIYYDLNAMIFPRFNFASKYIEPFLVTLFSIWETV